MKYNFTIWVIFFCLIASTINAQTTASATWQLNNSTKLNPTTSGSIDADDQKTTSTFIVRDYSGIDGAQRSYGESGTLGSWPTESGINELRYTEFIAYPRKGSVFIIDTVFVYLAQTSTNNLRANLYYSIKEDFSDQVLLNSSPLILSRDVFTKHAYAVNVEIADSQKIYFRIYPWLTASATGKYLHIKDVTIKGFTTGETVIFLPELSTANISFISTTTAVSGGNITSDGGGLINERGVCWNTTGNPTIENNRTIDGTGSGSFGSNITGLSINTKYYVRAYAENSAGVSYGEEKSFTTLSQLSLPIVTTSNITSILPTTAIGGGNITFDGGLPILAKGICWNTSGNPSLNDSFTEDGIGLGSYTSGMTSLLPTTTYYVRAYATNELGTAYGEEKNFTTSAPAPPVFVTVTKDGSGNHTTVQSAFDAVPDNYTGTYTIFVKKGIYKEKLLLGRNKINVVLQGEDRDSTILTYDDNANSLNSSGGTVGTSGSYSVGIDANDFTARDITFQNTNQTAQAVALRANGDRQIYYNCKMLGYQDTYYTYGYGRIYNKDCYIEGSVDFIFGRSITVFDNCIINCNRDGGVLTAASTEATYKFGYVFLNCKITTNEIGFNGNQVRTFYLGRPWQNEPQTVYINCELPVNLNPAGWTTMQVNAKLYAEYKCFGPGSDYSKRVSFSRQLTDQEAAEYTVQNIFAKSSGVGAFDWLPIINVSVDEQKKTELIPSSFKLGQNYPNPFNPITNIDYFIPSINKVNYINNKVSLRVFDLLGREVAVLVNEIKPPGSYKVQFNAMNLSSGVYFYSLQAGNFLDTKKLMLIK